MITVDQLSKNFGEIKAVDGISFSVERQQTMVLLGTSGCGKTTTLRMINRLIEPTSGKILIDGKNVLDGPPELLRRGIGYVLQNNGLFPHYTVEENIAIVPQLLKWDSKRTRRRISELIEKLRLSPDHLKAYPGELSGGQQQRVGLARALVADPPVLLMDEPFGALDNITRSQIHAEFKALDELKRKTIILVTHDVEEAFLLGDRICLMDKGKIVQNGSPGELLFKPASHFTGSFLKQQRLQLEFRAVQIEDIWDLLPDGKTDPPGIPLPADTDVWTGLEQMGPDLAGSLEISRGNERKSAGFEQLIIAFYQFQSRTHD
jgi:osmoprotectant transport system ATP-binding protein